MKRNVKDISMRMLLVSTVTGAVAIIILIAAVFFLSIYRQSLFSNAETTSAQTVEQVSITVGNYIDEISDLMEVLEKGLVEHGEDRDQFFETFLSVKPDIVAVTTYDEAGTLLNCYAGDQKLLEPINVNLSFDPEMMEQYQDGFISSPHVQTIFEGFYPWVVTMVAPTHTDQGERWIALDFQFRNISEYINGVGIGKHGYCYLMDEDGEIVYHPQQQLIYLDLKEENTGALTEAVNGVYVHDSTIYAVRELEMHHWKVVGVSLVEDLVSASVGEIAQLLLISAGIIFLIALASSALLSFALSRPLQKLSGQMRRFETETDRFVYEPVAGAKEVTSLSDSFGHMVEKIQVLMDTIRKEEINLRKTELRALQAQINPHFLYNTLDSISWMCEQSRTSDAVGMINALARLFRISISHGHELIPIHDELIHAESYLKIQMYRYKNQFEYSFQVDESCLECFCNKITLQPIIENAIYHGINGLVTKGEIRICIRPDGEDVLFEVADNGVGIEPERIEGLLRDESNSHTGMGLKNVNDRLKIYFGDRYGITIDSVLDEGTLVTIRMPRILEGSEYEMR